MKEEELIKACIKNNRKAQSVLFERYKDTLFLTSLKYCRNEAAAEDNLHDAFVVIFQKIKNYNHRGSFEGWMRRITINKAIDTYKANREIPIEINNDILVDHTVDFDTTTIGLNEILSAIQTLPDQYRLVFNMFQMDGYSHKEIATLLGISEGTSKSNYHRAKGLLKARLEAKTAEHSNHKTISHGA